MDIEDSINDQTMQLSKKFSDKVSDHEQSKGYIMTMMIDGGKNDPNILYKNTVMGNDDEIRDFYQFKTHTYNFFRRIQGNGMSIIQIDTQGEIHEKKIRFYEYKNNIFTFSVPSGCSILQKRSERYNDSLYQKKTAWFMRIFHSKSEHQENTTEQKFVISYVSIFNQHHGYNMFKNE